MFDEQANLLDEMLAGELGSGGGEEVRRDLAPHPVDDLERDPAHAEEHEVRVAEEESEALDAEFIYPNMPFFGQHAADLAEPLRERPVDDDPPPRQFGPQV